jgi:hypothetical protein
MSAQKKRLSIFDRAKLSLEKLIANAREQARREASAIQAPSEGNDETIVVSRHEVEQLAVALQQAETSSVTYRSLSRPSVTELHRDDVKLARARAVAERDPIARARLFAALETLMQDASRSFGTEERAAIRAAAQNERDPIKRGRLFARADQE